MQASEPTDILQARMERKLRARLRAERRFRLYGQGAIVLAGLTLLLMLSVIGAKAFAALTRYEVSVQIQPTSVNARAMLEDVRQAVADRFDEPENRAEIDQSVGRFVSLLDVTAAARHLEKKGLKHGKSVKVSVPVSHQADAFLHSIRHLRLLTPDQLASAETLRAMPLASVPAAVSQAVDLDGGGAWLLVHLEDGSYLWKPEQALEKRLSWSVPPHLLGRVLLMRDGAGRSKISDLDAAILVALRAQGDLHLGANTAFFQRGDSNEPELAGVLAALVGSVMIIIVTMSLALPIGVGAAIYLEEFAGNTRLTNFLSANINNLAAVPSIVFGLLGAAILINGIGFPIPFTDWRLQLGGGLGRGWPLVVGLVLALMVLPTIIIASRAALSNVSNRIREAALSLGASRLQTVFHHVLPHALPGILTGSIISLAYAIGETAPLLLLGVFAFVGDVPTGITDRSSALPVLIYQWSSRTGQSWEPLTAAAIVTLLLIMLVMNALAIWIRIKFDRKKD